MFQRILDVVPQCHGQTRGCRNDTGKPDHRNDPDQHVNDLRGRRAGTDGGIDLGSVRRNRATHRNQRRNAGNGQGSRIEVGDLDPIPGTFLPDEVCTVDGQEA